MKKTARYVVTVLGTAKLYDATYTGGASADTPIIDGTASEQNWGAADIMTVGEHASLDQNARGLIKFDLSSIPADAEVQAATLTLYRNLDRSTNARTMRAYRVLRNWVEAQATDIIYSTGNNWQTALAGGALDAESTDIGSVDLPAGSNSGAISPVKVDLSLTPASVQEWIDGTLTNYGIKLRMDTETDDRWGFATKEHATTSIRPSLTITYKTRTPP